MLEPILCGPPAWAPLLPKLRGHFAEFLNNASPAGLRILSSSTCVGLRYGYSMNNSGFSWHMAHGLRYFFSLHVTSSDCCAVFPSQLLPRLYRFSLSRLPLPTCVPTVLSCCSTGISTCCPSATSFDLAETCVFGKQLPGPLHCGPLMWAPLLPKLRGYFAEFLNNSSLAHLRILSSSTCVGLRYGYL